MAFDNRKRRMRFDIGYLHSDDLNLRKSLFVFPLFLILSVVLADLPAPSSSRISLLPNTHFLTLFIFVPHRPDMWIFCWLIDG